MAYVSGFTGSAGTVIVTDVEAVLWTDSRYFIQAESQMDAEFWTLMKSGKYFHIDKWKSIIDQNEIFAII